MQFWKQRDLYNWDLEGGDLDWHLQKSLKIEKYRE